MQYNPHPYQVSAYNWIMEHDKCGLFLDMGLGKTVVTLTAIKDLIDSLDMQKVLVIAPKRVAEDTWSRECSKWDHLKDLRIAKVIGDAKTRKAQLQRDADIYIINRENVKWLTDNCRWFFDTVVIDELSSFKNHTSQRFRALRKHIVKAQHVIALTGTPAPQGYLDLWSEIYLLDRGERLGGTFSSYRDIYFRDVSRDMTYGIYIAKPGAEEHINGLVEDICMSMQAEDYLQMPERIDNYIPVKMSAQETLLYQKMEQDMFLCLPDGEDVEAFSAAAVMNKLLQLANGFVYDRDGVPHKIHEKKLDALEEIIDTNPGDPILVFYSFRADQEALLHRFPKARILNNSQDIADWNTGKAPVMIAHPASVGHGLNIQDGGHIVVWYGCPWSLELYQQANARLYRQGQKHSAVIINHLMTVGTVDDRVIKALGDKDLTQAALMAALKERRKESKRKEKTEE